MAIRILCSNPACGQEFEDETTLDPQAKAGTADTSSRQEVVVICPFCEKPSRIEVPTSRLKYHYIDRGIR